ncbi:MAG: divergent PAP2 family protein [Lachnospiraceae bacterium]|nr:divergent PAP2 family protein [Lachnospiraceae bacterium]
MNFLKELVLNKPLIIAAMSWLTAGILKMFVELKMNKKLVISRVVGAGGMPSSHTATVVALSIALGYYEGLGSAAFALSVIFTIIVIHDAVGVRLETGKQAKVLNTMIFETNAFKELDFETALKEYVGHTPSQAFVGALVGVLVSIFMIFVVYGKV